MPTPTIEGSPNQTREADVDTVNLYQVSGVHVEAPMATTSFALTERKRSGGCVKCTKLTGLQVASLKAAALAS
jgi:hypothetical protein